MTLSPSQADGITAKIATLGTRSGVPPRAACDKPPKVTPSVAPSRRLTDLAWIWIGKDGRASQALVTDDRMRTLPGMCLVWSGTARAVRLTLEPELISRCSSSGR